MKTEAWNLDIKICICVIIYLKNKLSYVEINHHFDVSLAGKRAFNRTLELLCRVHFSSSAALKPGQKVYVCLFNAAK